MAGCVECWSGLRKLQVTTEVQIWPFQLWPYDRCWDAGCGIQRSGWSIPHVWAALHSKAFWISWSCNAICFRILFRCGGLRCISGHESTACAGPFMATSKSPSRCTSLGPHGKKAVAGYTSPLACSAVLMKRGVTLIVFYVACSLFLLVGLSSLCLLVCRRTRPASQDGKTPQNCYNLEQLMQSSASRKILEDISSMPYGKLLASKVAEALEDGEVPVQYSHLKGYCGWGIAKVNGAFSYHRLQYNGRGRGASAETWETSEAFIRWLQEQSDRSMAVYGFTDAELRSGLSMMSTEYWCIPSCERFHFSSTIIKHSR